jgi:hypothetical protein
MVRMPPHPAPTFTFAQTCPSRRNGVPAVLHQPGSDEMVEGDFDHIK